MTKTKIQQFWNRIPPHGQSLVELALFFPIILLLLSGLVEFGFMLNDYLNLMDGPRDAARLAVDMQPFTGTGTDTNYPFYTTVADEVLQSISPYTLDPTRDDIVISVYGFRDQIIYGQFPNADAGNGVNYTGEFSMDAYYHAKGTNASTFYSRRKITDTQVASTISTHTPRIGAVVVELFYSYEQKLALPWITVFLPNPVKLHMYAAAPLPAATPQECPDILNPSCP
jgi:hypothetical protein